MNGRSESTRTRSRDVEGALVDAAEAVLVREGAAALTVRAVATEAGVAPMGVYNRFGSKDGLLDALLVRGFRRFEATLRSNPEVLPLPRLRACGQQYRTFALANPRFYELMFQYAGSLDAHSQELDAAGGAAFGVLVENVVAAQAAGGIRPGDPAELAQLIWSAVHGAMSLELAGRTLTPDPEASYENLLELIVEGLQTRPAEHG
ncbi:TetR/AcrR family transcriptional regulator [Spongisporangium articulatum]|uniref:TetR/AcrR family transcriptional regulator n=1 Tax=Spongisporangium articulatum TaxID=3362603 RepID=A0ABW8ANW9_9ACTN